MLIAAVSAIAKYGSSGLILSVLASFISDIDL